jgi:hypothetical protein
MGRNDDARKDLKAARKELAEHKGGEDDQYRELNSRVVEAENRLPWHQR